MVTRGSVVGRSGAGVENLSESSCGALLDRGTKRSSYIQPADLGAGKFLYPDSQIRIVLESRLDIMVVLCAHFR